MDSTSGADDTLAECQGLIRQLNDNFDSLLAERVHAQVEGRRYREQIERLKEALRLTYGYAAAIQRMSVFAPIGFRCSLILETVSCALPDDEAKRLHEETKIILDTLTESRT